jgi:hypothetical protein
MQPTHDGTDTGNRWSAFAERAMRVNLSRRIIVAVCVPSALAAVICCASIPYNSLATQSWVWLAAIVLVGGFQWFWWGPAPEAGAAGEAPRSAAPGASALGDDPAVTWMNDPQGSLPESPAVDAAAAGLADAGLSDRP